MALQVLTALDRARTQRYHFMAILIAGLGFYTDAYDLFAIIPITKLLGRLYYYKEGETEPGTLPAGVYGALLGMAYCGALCGQLFFGWAGDKLGRRKVYGITLTLMMVSSITCGLSFGRTAKSVMTTLCFFRFWIGFGLGGDYPLSATIMSEYSNTSSRGAFVAAVFAMQGFGILSAAAVTLGLSAIFKTAYKSPTFYQNAEKSTPLEADYLWRTVLMLGALPAALTYYYRMRMPETARYTALVLGEPAQATEDMEGVLDIPFQDRNQDMFYASRSQELSPGLESVPPKEPFGLFSKEFARRHGKELLGVTGCWFLTDVVFYSLNMYQKDIFAAVRWLPKAKYMSALEETYKISRAQALIALVATVPGYWVTVATIDRIGRKKIQLLGFFMMALFMVVLAADFKNLRDKHPTSFVAMYALTFFFANFGPNATTFIIPAELFPARLRTTCNGIAAAAGKAGAIVGAFGIVRNDDRVGSKSQLVLGMIAICNFIGFGFTALLPETNGIALEVLSGESGCSEPKHTGMSDHKPFSGFSVNSGTYLITHPTSGKYVPSSGEGLELKGSHTSARGAFDRPNNIRRSSSVRW